MTAADATKLIDEFMTAATHLTTAADQGAVLEPRIEQMVIDSLGCLDAMIAEHERIVAIRAATAAAYARFRKVA
jgi:hypothetical protein